jgi:hypothetical protein
MKLGQRGQVLCQLRQGLIICAIGAAAVPFAGRADAADCTGALTKLSACPVGTGANVDVNIGTDPNCLAVYVDQSLRFRKITVGTNGALCVRDSDLNNVPGQSLALEAEQIVVNGTFQVGSQQAAIGSGNPANHVIIRFTGAAPAQVQDGAMNMDQPCPDPAFQKGLQLCQGGVLRMFGNKGAPAAGSQRNAAGKVSWTYLSEPTGDPCRFGPDSGAGSPVTKATCARGLNANTIELADAVDWQIGDWIVIATTSFSPFETEFARIEAIDATRKVLTLVDQLAYYHFGGPDPGPPSPANFNADQTTNWGVDERAEVGLISRNITLTADLSGSPNDHWGGETIFRQGFKEASVQGVEFALLGKPKLGSYPVHFHKDGPIGTDQVVLFNANSIHHTFNKCVTVHSTQHLTIQNTVCARAVGHLFYQEIGDEEDITFAYNLGLGAMSNDFDIHAQAGFSGYDDLIDRYWWPGDKLARRSGFANYYALNVGNHDNQTNPTHGKCRKPLPNGGLGGGDPPPCKPSEYYEPASGFWIINPATKLIGNSIGGCQGVGRAYWYVPPSTQGSNLKFMPIGTFQNNRGHSCYAGVYAEQENDVVSEQLQPHKDGAPKGPSEFNVIDGITITRMRDRGIWLRPSYWVVKNARLATNRHSVSLVTAGGVDGTAPGNWALLEDSVLVGISRNNVDRFGPCPYPGITGLNPPGPSGGELGCIDQTPFDGGKVGRGGDDTGRGYPEPKWNFFGLMIYDGPGRYFRDRFVNFNRDISPYLTAADQAFLGWYSANYPNLLAPDPKQPGSFVYEGDAALGWFNANQSAYPNTQASEGLTFENVDLRHQIYTDRVGVDKFNDGDKNTLILDRDGSLTGMKVVGPDKTSPVGNIFPASLNNLPFNASSNSVDECRSTGMQNERLEGRPTSLISPSPMATLEFSALFPVAPQGGDNPTRYEQWLTFAKTAPDTYPAPVNTIRGDMALHGRDGRGMWEPKVSNGYGYTVSATSKYSAPGKAPAPAGADVGIPAAFNLGLTDAILPLDPKTHKVLAPFHVRVAICFTDKNGNHPQPKTDIKKMFKVVRGYKSYGLPTSNEDTLRNYWRKIEDCNNLDADNPKNKAGCPAKTVVVNGECPDGDPPENNECPTKELTANDGRTWENDENSWFYDKSGGRLYLHILQRVDNAVGPSPTGSCDPSVLPRGASPPPECPNMSKVPENYYFCPAGGCVIYGVQLVESELTGPYVPGQSTCGGVVAGEPIPSGFLADLKTGVILQRDPQAPVPLPKPHDEAFPHYALKGGNEAAMCPNLGPDNQPFKQPPWGAIPDGAPQPQSFQVNYPADPNVPVDVKVEETLREGVQPTQYRPIAGNLILDSLEKGKSYTITLSSRDKRCSAKFVADGTRSKPHFTRTDDGRCIPANGGGLISAGLP